MIKMQFNDKWDVIRLLLEMVFIFENMVISPWLAIDQPTLDVVLVLLQVGSDWFNICNRDLI